MDLEKEVKKIKERNKKVEQDKAWETSWTRRIIITIMTYIVVTSLFVVAKLPNPYINSMVPSLAFLLSTSSLHLFKKMWKN